ncbi:MAG: hypothetical protein WKF81_02130 [Thermomicrobiales bacterium]
MSDSRIFPEGVGKSSEDVDSFLDDLAQGQHATNRPPLDDTESTIVSEWEKEQTGDRSSSSAKDKGQEAVSTAKDKGQEAVSTAKDKGQEAVSTAKDKASEVSGQAQDKADQGMTKAGDSIGQAADALRQRGEGTSGAMGTAATTAADTLDSAGSYLREKDTDQVLKDLEDLIRRKPVESLLIAAGAGFVLSKILG